MTKNTKNKSRRVLAACQRCKLRKKKCDGKLPTCSGCESSGTTCEYAESNLQFYRHSIIQQLDRLNQLEDMMARVNGEVTRLRSDILTAQVNEAASNDENQQKQTFVDPVLNLVKQPTNDQVFIGQSAMISKVHAIRKILSKDQDFNTDPLYQIKNKPMEEVDMYEPGPDLENFFVECYLIFSRNRYQFVEKPDVLRIFKKPILERDRWETFVVYIVLANGCRISELCKLVTRPSPKFYFDKAFEILSQLPVLTLMQQIRVCMMLALYLNYSYDFMNPFVMNVWELSGMAVRKMIQLGYHKKKTPKLENCVEVELEKRLFWSVYAFDRLLSLALGRPPSIPDFEIDIPYPLSLENVEEHSPRQIVEWQLKQLNDPTFTLPLTSLTYLIHICKMREIEFEINMYAYGKGEYLKDFEELDKRLEDWVSSLPQRKEYSEGVRNEVPYEYFTLHYHRAKLSLILTKISDYNKVNSIRRLNLLSKMLASSSGICKAFNKIQREPLFGFSTFSLHTIFLAGVTLVYCVWALGRPPYIKTHNDIRICSNLLYSFSERAREAEIYRILFENLVENILYNEDVDGGSSVYLQNEDTQEKAYPHILEDSLFTDNKMFNFTFDDDFWRRLDFNSTSAG